MAISTINQSGLNAPLTLTSPVLTTPSVTGGTFSSPTMTTPALGTPSALVLTNATGLPASATPAGSVIQTIFSSTSTSNAVNSTSLVASNLTGVITPQFSNSKILVTYTIHMTAQSGRSSEVFYNRLYKSISGGSAGFIGSTTVMFAFDARNVGVIYGQTCVNCSYVYLDSPATTSATTYVVYGNIADQSGNAVSGDFLGFGGLATMVLQEIKQ